MTNTDPITPTELLAFAERCETRSNTGRLAQDFHDIARDARAIAGELRTDLQREQANDKRIDDLAKLFYDAEIGEFSDPWNYPKYRDRKPEFRRGTIAGVRALIAKLNEECELQHARNKAAAVGSGQWDSLDDVPGEVSSVYNAYGDLLCRIDGGWLNTEWNLHPTGRNGGPFTESSGSVSKRAALGDEIVGGAL